MDNILQIMRGNSIHPGKASLSSSKVARRIIPLGINKNRRRRRVLEKEGQKCYRKFNELAEK